MTVMIDIIGAAILTGILMVTILTMNANLSSETYRSVSTVSVQTEAMQLARIMEFDFYKIGYDVSKPAISLADSSRVIFKANLKNIVGGSDVVEYTLGAVNSSSTNPSDKTLSRYENSARVFISFSVTRFKLQYYDARDAMLASTPLSAALRDSVRSIKIILSMESPEPYTSAYHVDSTYSGAYYEKVIYPRNLQ